MKDTKKNIYHTLWTVPKRNEKIVETDIKSIPLAHIYHFSYCGTYLNNKNERVS